MGNGNKINFNLLNLFFTFFFMLTLFSMPPNLALAQETSSTGTYYEIRNNQGHTSTSVSFGSSSSHREIFLLARVEKDSSGAWMDAVLLKDGDEIHRIRTHTNHAHADKNYDLAYKATIGPNEHPTFTVKASKVLDPTMDGFITLTAIAVEVR